MRIQVTAVLVVAVLALPFAAAGLWDFDWDHSDEFTPLDIGVDNGSGAGDDEEETYGPSDFPTRLSAFQPSTPETLLPEDHLSGSPLPVKLQPGLADLVDFQRPKLLPDGDHEVPPLLFPGTYRHWLDNITVTESSQPPPNETLIGCFSTRFVESTLFYRAPHSLSWQEGVDLCDHRLTRYAGVQADPESPSHNFIFCGNDIVEHSVEVNGSLCQGCADNNALSCSGDHVMSVYKIRDSTPLALLLATDTGVEMFRSDYNSFTTQILIYQNNVSAIDICFNGDGVFFIASKNIYSSYSPYSMAYLQPGPEDSGSVLYDLAVDWVFNKTYWSAYHSQYTYYRQIEMSDFSGKALGRVILGTAQCLIVDPFERLLFFIRNDKLHSFHLERMTIMQFHPTTLHMNLVTKVALDFQKQRVYLVGTQDESRGYLASMAYDGTQVKVLLNSTLLKGVFALDVIKDEVFWGVYHESLYKLYQCRLTPTCNTANLTLLYQSTKIIRDFTIYHPEKQTPSAKYLCAQLQCSHGCSSVSPSVAECTCPEEMVMSSDSRTCQDKSAESSNKQQSEVTMQSQTGGSSINAISETVTMRTVYRWIDLDFSEVGKKKPSEIPLSTTIGNERQRDTPTESSNKHQSEVTTPSQTGCSSINTLSETVTKEDFFFVHRVTADDFEEDEKNTSDIPLSTTIANERQRGEMSPVEVQNSEASSDDRQVGQMCDDKSKFQDSNIFSFEIFNSVVSVSMLSALIVIMYLLLKSLKNTGHFGYSHEPAAELKELTITTHNI